MEDVLAIVGVFFSPAIMIVLIVWFKSRERIKRYRLQAEVYAKSLETGHSIPENLFAEPKKCQKNLSLKIGMICISIGIGIALTCRIIAAIAIDHLDLMEATEQMSLVFKMFSTIGIIPFLIGVAFVIIHFIGKGKSVGENVR